VADILEKLRGAEISVDAPATLVGRIVSVEDRPTGLQGKPRATLVLLDSKGLHTIALDDVVDWRFTDPGLMEDFDRALALMLDARNADRRTLEIHLPGTGSREAALGYVVAAPVWKAAYRLDLSGPKPWIQGWAIVDNPSRMDWKDIRLSLASGKPISFIQRLYAPLDIERPIVPLSIAGTVEPLIYESGTEGLSTKERSPADASTMRAMAGSPESAGRPESRIPRPAFDLASGAAADAMTSPVGAQFEFTIKTPVTIERGHSAMLPLVAGGMDAEKVSIFTADSGERNPMLGVWLSNSLDMQLPPGPITVFDGGTYAGDALLEFLPERERRLVVYGRDLSVEASDSKSSARETTAVKLSNGVLTFSRRVTWTRTYEFRNASGESRKLIVEHPITEGAELLSPKSYVEKTASLYRFSLDLPAGGTTTLDVEERVPASERVVVAGLDAAAYLSYASSSEMPREIGKALEKAADLANGLVAAKRNLADISGQRAAIVDDQSRIRSNLAVVGRDSTQGQQYLKRLMDSEAILDDLSAKMQKAKNAVQDAQLALDSYVGGLDLGD